MSRSDSIYSREEVAHITRHFSIEDDTCQETPEDFPRLYKLEGLAYPLINSKPIPRDLAEAAMTYIRFATKSYPFNLRYAVGEPMWIRFMEKWEETGDRQKALRAI